MAVSMHGHRPWPGDGMPSWSLDNLLVLVLWIAGR